MLTVPDNSPTGDGVAVRSPVRPLAAPTATPVRSDTDLKLDPASAEFVVISREELKSFEGMLTRYRLNLPDGFRPLQEVFDMQIVPHLLARTAALHLCEDAATVMQVLLDTRHAIRSSPEALRLCLVWRYLQALIFLGGKDDYPCCSSRKERLAAAQSTSVCIRNQVDRTDSLCRS